MKIQKKIFSQFNLSEKNAELFFFIGLFYLILVCFLGSFFQTFYYLLYFDRSSLIIFVIRGLFFLFCWIQFVKPNFGLVFVSLVLHPFFQKFCKNLEEIIQEIIQKFPLSTFVFVHFFISLTFLHLFMLTITGIDHFVEYVYQIFNLVKLCFFPVILSLYVYTQIPTRFYIGWENLTDPEKLEKLKKLAENVAQFIAEESKKKPRITKVSFAITLSFSAVLSWGSATEKGVQKASQITGIRSCDIDPLAIASNPELQENFRRLVNAELESSSSWIYISLQDTIKFFQGQPVLLSEHRQALANTITQQKETLGQLELKRLALQDAESLGIQGSHAASVLLDRSKPENTPLADDSEIVSIREIGNVKPQSPQAPSCLELFQW